MCSGLCECVREVRSQPQGLCFCWYRCSGDCLDRPGYDCRFNEVTKVLDGSSCFVHLHGFSSSKLEALFFVFFSLCKCSSSVIFSLSGGTVPVLFLTLPLLFGPTQQSKSALVVVVRRKMWREDWFYISLRGLTINCFNLITNPLHCVYSVVTLQCMPLSKWSLSNLEQSSLFDK